jgi:conjugal transfer/entry exclusion protein
MRRLTPGARALIASSVAVFVLVGAAAPAAAAGSGTSPQKWADGVCSAVDDWIESVESTIQGLRGAGSLEDAAQQAINGLDTATTQLTTSIEELGRPSTSDAKKAQDAVEKLSNDLSTDLDSIKNELSNPPSDPAGIASLFAQIGIEVENAIDQVKSTATTLKGLSSKGRLKKAFQSSSECKSLKSRL